MGLTHFDQEGNAVMVDVTEKAVTYRTALAEGRVRMSPETLELVRTGGAPKGDVLAVAQVAGIMAARAAQAGHGTQMQGRPAGPSGPGGPGRPS